VNNISTVIKKNKENKLLTPQCQVTSSEQLRSKERDPARLYRRAGSREKKNHVMK
jgi:hypothetical protein